MELVLPSNWQPDLIGRVSGPEAHSVYAALPSAAVGGGRPSALLPPVGRRRARAHIKEAHQAGLGFNYILNAPSLDNQEFSRAGQRRIHKLLDWIDDAGVDAVTVTVPLLLELIKRHHPRLRVGVSTLAGVDSPQCALRWEGLGADSITLSVVGVGRSFRTIEAIRQAVGLELVVIANLSCDHGCPYMHYHGVTEGHASRRGHHMGGHMIDYCRASCLLHKMNDPAAYLRAPWIRPEDQGLYRDLGVDRLKLVNRLMTTEGIGRIVDAYRAGRYEGNLFDLLDFPPKQIHATRGLAGKVRLALHFARPGQVNPLRLARGAHGSPEPDDFYLDNRALDGFVQRFVEQDCNGRTCQGCVHCGETAQRLLRISPSAREQVRARNDRLLDGLIGGSLFRWRDPRGAAPQFNLQRPGQRKRWDRLYEGTDPRTLPWNRLPLFEATRSLLGLLPLERMSRAVDLGCGSGEMTARLQRETGLAFMGVDLSPVALARSAWSATAGAPQFLAADVLDLPFRSGSFHLATDRGCLHSLGQGLARRHYLAEVHRVLAPGGWFLLVTMGADPARPMASFASRMLLRAVTHLGPGELERLVQGRFTLQETSIEQVHTPLSHRYLPLQVPALFQCHLLRRIDM